jgi:ribosomal protein S18 acetylase RimI-like enzyme
MASSSTSTPPTYTRRSATIKDEAIFAELVSQLYKEDHRQVLDTDTCKKTLREFLQHPEKGGVYMLEQEKKVIGYTILVVFWANEFGGNIVTIDELFLKPEHRDQGIGTHLIESLLKEQPYDAVGFYLVTSPDNHSAQRLYQRLGFKPYKDPAFLYEYKKTD